MITCINNEINWLDPLRPAWTTTNCGLTTIITDEYLVAGIDFNNSIFSAQVIHAPTGPTFVQDAIDILNPIITPGTWYQIAGIGEIGIDPDMCLSILAWEGIVQQLSGLTIGTVYTLTIEVTPNSNLEILQYNNTTLISTFPVVVGLNTFTFTASSPNDTFVFTAANGACCTWCISSISITGPAIEETICDDSECIIINVVNQNNVAIPEYPIYLNGGLVGKTDEFGRLKFQIENASIKKDHILNFCLCIKTEGVCRQQIIKIVVQEECPPGCCEDPTGVSCETYVSPVQIFNGCTDPNASNYNPMALVDDGTCLYCNPDITITETHVNASSAILNDGSITTVASNGTLPYTYSWIGPNGYTASTASISGLAGGVYILEVTDLRNCINTITVMINQASIIYGCMDATTGLWPNINGLNQNGTICSYPCTTDGTITGTPNGYKYFCYNPDAIYPDKCCEAGCKDILALPSSYCAPCEYDCNMEFIYAAGYTQNPGWDSCCNYCIQGCMDSIAGNFDPLATCDDGSCIYYYECYEAGYDYNEIDLYNYQLNSYVINISSTGFYEPSGSSLMDVEIFYVALADYYSSFTKMNTPPGTEVTGVGDNTSNGNWMNFVPPPATPCPVSTLNTVPINANTMPLYTIAGYSTINPHPGGNTGSNSCYALLQVTDYGLGHVFLTWNDYVTWHNSPTGPSATCAGTQIPTIVPSLGNDFTWTQTKHANINNNPDPYTPQPYDNWVYYVPLTPECTGYHDCECDRVFTVEDNNGNPGTYPTQVLCENDIDTCCGQVTPVYGCIDNGQIQLQPDFGTYGATTAQDWWTGLNAAGVDYSTITCNLGIFHYNLSINGGGGGVGGASASTYQTGIPAINYDSLATVDDGSCCYCTGCMVWSNDNYEVNACYDDSSLC